MATGSLELAPQYGNGVMQQRSFIDHWQHSRDLWPRWWESLLVAKGRHKVKVTFPLLSMFFPSDCVECPCMKGDRTHVSNSFFPDEGENGLFMPYVG